MSEAINIAKLRRDCNVRQKELAVMLGVSTRHLRAVESGHRASKSLVAKAVSLIGAKK